MKKKIDEIEQAEIMPEYAGAELEYEVYNVGEAEWKKNSALIPAEAYASFNQNHVLLKSPITTPIGPAYIMQIS